MKVLIPSAKYFRGSTTEIHCMRSENQTIEEKVDRLYEHIESLSRRVAELEGRTGGIHNAGSID